MKYFAICVLFWRVALIARGCVRSFACLYLPCSGPAVVENQQGLHHKSAWAREMKRSIPVAAAAARRVHARNVCDSIRSRLRNPARASLCCDFEHLPVPRWKIKLNRTQ